MSFSLKLWWESFQTITDGPQYGENHDLPMTETKPVMVLLLLLFQIVVMNLPNLTSWELSSSNNAYNLILLYVSIFKIS